MNEQELLRATQFAAFWGTYGIYFSIGLMVVTTGAFLSWLCAFPLLWSIIRHDRGVDRIAWIITVLIPFLGPIAYIAHYAAEKDNDWAQKYGPKRQPGQG